MCSNAYVNEYIFNIWTHIHLNLLSPTHSFSIQYLLKTYNFPGNVLDANDSVVSKTDNILLIS